MVGFTLKTIIKYLRFRWEKFVLVSIMALWPISFSLNLAKFGDTTTGPSLFAILISVSLLALGFDFFGTYMPSVRRRQQAIQGILPEKFLAVQPKPDTDLLHLPAEIVLYDGPPQLISLMTFFAAHIIPLTCVVFILIAIVSLHSFLIGAISFVSLVVTECGVIAIFVWMMRRDQHIIIEVTADGLTKRYLGWRFGSIRWEDARLFALITQRDAHTRGLTYELAGDKGSMTWREVWQPSPLIGPPESSLDEQSRQIAALNALVVAKTGLRLYDLRDNRGRS